MLRLNQISQELNSLQTEIKFLQKTIAMMNQQVKSLEQKHGADAYSMDSYRQLLASITESSEKLVAARKSHKQITSNQKVRNKVIILDSTSVVAAK